MPEGGVLGLIDETARTFPDRLALADDRECLTYRELVSVSIAIGRALEGARHGLKEQAFRVALRDNPSVRFVAVALGIWRARGIYVPLPLGYPGERLESIRTVARPSLELDRTSIDQFYEAALLAEAKPPELCAAYPLPESDAYILFTSGTTGRPKGVPISHAALSSRLAWMRAEHRLGEGDTLLQKASIGFDVSLVELFGPLVSGAKVFIAPPETSRRLNDIVHYVRREKVTSAVFMPSQLAQVLALPGANELPLTRVFTGGEAFGMDLVRQFYAIWPKASLYNGYGPTEAAISVTAWCAQSTAQEVELGRPLPNVQLLILDNQEQPVTSNGEGELLIGGPCITRGYLKDESGSDNESSFVTLLCDGIEQRFYRTGDRVRLEADALRFVGRRDRQTKVRGVRVELDEVEGAIRACPSVIEAAVVVQQKEEGNHLIAYFVPTKPLEPLSLVRNWLQRHLPREVIPELRALAQLPLTENGKTDYGALHLEARSARAEQEVPNSDGPFDDIYGLIRASWRLVLEHDNFTNESDFFHVGGSSLNVVRLLAVLSEKSARAIELVSLFEHTTVTAQGRLLSDAVELSSPDNTTLKEVKKNDYPFLVLLKGTLSEWDLNALSERGGANGQATQVSLGVRLEHPDLAPCLAQELRAQPAPDGEEVTVFLGESASILAYRVSGAHPGGKSGDGFGLADLETLLTELWPHLRVIPGRDVCASHRWRITEPDDRIEQKMRETFDRFVNYAHELNGSTNVSGSSRFQASTSPFHLDLPPIERFHSQCLLGALECVSRFHGLCVAHDRVLGEHSIQVIERANGAVSLTRTFAPMSVFRERLARFHGISFKRHSFSGEPFAEITATSLRKQTSHCRLRL